MGQFFLWRRLFFTNVLPGYHRFVAGGALAALDRKTKVRNTCLSCERCNDMVLVMYIF